jgi:cytochrome c-type biogenesis protein
MAVGPCSLAYVAPLMVLLFKEAETNLPFAVLIMSAYVLGYGIILTFCGTMTEFVHKYLNWDEKSKGTHILNRVCGILIIAAGLFFIYHAP